MRLKCTTSSLPSPQNSDKYEASACVSIRQHTSAFVSIRQNSSAYVDIQPLPSPENSGKYAIRSETLSALVTTASASFYISIRHVRERERERERGYHAVNEMRRRLDDDASLLPSESFVGGFPNTSSHLTTSNPKSRGHTLDCSPETLAELRLARHR
jgi:hypothetical protein